MFSVIPPEVLTYLKEKAGCYEYRELYHSSQSLILEAASSKWNRSSNNNRVVVKIQSLHSNALRRSFKREVKIHSRIYHSSTHICTSLLKAKRLIISSSSPPTVNFEVGVMIMERMEMDLMDYMLNSQFIPISTIKMIFKVICQSVLECHKQGITHLDLKPENILLNLLGRAITDIKLCDFGCSFHHQNDENDLHHQEDGEIDVHPHLENQQTTQRRKQQSRRKIQSGRFGTLQYLPPECITHTSEIFDSQTTSPLFQLYTEKIDVYALGVIYVNL
jgi:serine/threonine protein kinase